MVEWGRVCFETSALVGVPGQIRDSSIESFPIQKERRILHGKFSRTVMVNTAFYFTFRCGRSEGPYQGQSLLRGRGDPEIPN